MLHIMEIPSNNKQSFPGAPFFSIINIHAWILNQLWSELLKPHTHREHTWTMCLNTVIQHQDLKIYVHIFNIQGLSS